MPVIQTTSPTAFTLTTEGKPPRKFLVDELSPIEDFRLNSLLGAKDSANPATYLHAMFAVIVREIDGFPYPFPTTYKQLENAIERLGRDGLATLTKYFQDKAETDADENLTRAGELPGTPD
jgi:hypothetical protein